mgnify:CR=1 FL=1
MQPPKWYPNMSDAAYLGYVLACAYLGIKPLPQY